MGEAKTRRDIAKIILAQRMELAQHMSDYLMTDTTISHHSNKSLVPAYVVIVASLAKLTGLSKGDLIIFIEEAYDNTQAEERHGDGGGSVEDRPADSTEVVQG